MAAAQGSILARDTGPVCSESKYLTLFALCEAVMQPVAQPLNMKLERIVRK